MRAAIGLADVGLAVFLVEREAELGGRVGGLGELFPHGKDGRALIAQPAPRRSGSGPRSPCSPTPR